MKLTSQFKLLLLVIIALLTSMVNLASVPCINTNVYEGKFLQKIKTRYYLDSLLMDKEFFVFYDDWGGAPWIIVTRDSVGYNFILPSRDKTNYNILSGPEYEFDTISVVNDFNNIFSWILDSLSVDVTVSNRTPNNPYIGQAPYWGKIGLEVYDRTGDNIFSYDRRTHSKIESQKMDIKAVFHDLFFLEIWISFPDERERIFFINNYYTNKSHNRWQRIIKRIGLWFNRIIGR